MALTLTHLKGDTYLIPSPTNIGVYCQESGAVLIDSGNDKEAGRQINRLVEQQGWPLKTIINTHSNADHIGGNAFLQNKTGCEIAATRGEAPFITDPAKEAAFLFGGFPHKGLRNKFLLAKPSEVNIITPSDGQIPGTSLRAVPLPGHYFDMIGIMTPDNVFFIADTLFPENVIRKYHLFYLLDIRAHLQTLEFLKNQEADLFVPSHGEPQRDIRSLVDINRDKVLEIINRLEEICSEPLNQEEILCKICEIYDVNLDATQYVLLSSTIRSYLSYLLEEGRLEYTFGTSGMLWGRVL